MYKLKNQIYLNTTTQVITFTSEDGAYTTIPMNPNNSDYQTFKKDLADGAELQDAEGNVIDGIAYLATLES